LDDKISENGEDMTYAMLEADEKFIQDLFEKSKGKIRLGRTAVK
jgi:hypothetical protein